jgi:hypothetical protein
MSNIKRMMDYEDGELSEKDEIAMFQKLINSGTVWHLQGSYGRRAMNLLRDGKCELATIPFKDAYGNRIPSRYEVAPGSTGAPLETRNRAE